MNSDNPFSPFPPPRAVDFPPATPRPGDAMWPIAPSARGVPDRPGAGEFSLGVPTVPASHLVAAPIGADVETLIRAAFAAGNIMIVITKDHRGLFQTSMKRKDGNAFAVEVHADVIASLRGALSLI